MIYDICKFKSEIKKLINANDFINIKISIGNINNNRIMNKNINERSFNIFHKFKKKRIKKKSIDNIKEYKYNDLTLLSYNEKKKNCYRKLLTTFLDFKINTNNKSIKNLRLELINHRVIDQILFPAIDKYDYTETYTKYNYFSKYKNSEIIIEFIKTNSELLFINFNTKIDNINFDNFIESINYYLSKLHFTKSKLII